jgi:hypothetical protein
MDRTYSVHTLYETVNQRLKNRQPLLNKKQFINNPQEQFYSRLSWELNPRHTSRNEISSSEFKFIISVINNIDKLDGNLTSNEIRTLNDQLTQIKIILGKYQSRNPNDNIDISESIPKPKPKRIDIPFFRSKKRNENTNVILAHGEQYKSQMVQNYNTILLNNKQNFNTEQVKRFQSLIKKIQSYKHEIIPSEKVQYFKNELQHIVGNKNSTTKTNKSISKLHRLFNKVKKYGSNYFTRL